MESTSLQDYLHLSFCAPNTQSKLGRLLAQFGTIKALLDELDLRPAQGSDRLIVELRRTNGCCKNCTGAVRNALKWQEKASNTIICFEDPRYPPLLKEIDDPPPLLYVEGNFTLLRQTQIAVIGSRRASSYGLRNAYWISQELSKLGVTLTSGMAAGIDRKAHEGALAQNGNTIAVVGTGIDGCYPRLHKDLRQAIAEQGAIVSEFPLGSSPHSFHFPQRNRIISGLSRGVVVVEAGLKSGSLITARLAMEQNREVFALPGQITNPLAEGCHTLINEGVKLVQCVDDIAQEVGLCTLDAAATPNLSPPGASTNAERQILTTLKAEPATLDFLLASTDVPEEMLIMSLSALESKQLIQFIHGRYNYCSRR